MAKISIALDESEIKELKLGSILVLDNGMRLKLMDDKKVHIVKVVGGSKEYTKVFRPNPQGAGLTTLSKNEDLELVQNHAKGQHTTIYRGDVKDEKGNIVTKDLTDEYYKAHATKIYIDLDANGDVKIINQSSINKYEIGDSVSVSLKQEITF